MGVWVESGQVYWSLIGPFMVHTWLGHMEMGLDHGVQR